VINDEISLTDSTDLKNAKSDVINVPENYSSIQEAVMGKGI